MHIHVDHNNDFTDAQRNCITGWYLGHTSDKALARYLGISAVAVRNRLHNLMHKADIPYDTPRAEAMLLIWERGLVNVKRAAGEAAKHAAVVVLCVLSSGFYIPTSNNDDTTDTTDATRYGGRKVRRNPAQMARARRGRDNFTVLLDDITARLDI